MQRVFVTMAAVGAVWAMCGPGSPAHAADKIKIGKPVQYAGATTIGQSQTLVQPSSKADFSRIRRVVIPYFQIEVQSKGGKDASSKGFMSKMKNNVSVTYTIDGVDGAAMQALADRLYGDLVQSFKARGIEVIDRQAALAKSKNYAKIEAAYQQGPLEKGMAGGGKSMFYAPTGMGLYFVGVENAGNGQAKGLGGLGGAFGAFSQMGNVMAEIYALSELDAAIVGMRLKVAFVDADAFKMDGFVSVSHKAAITIEPLDTQMWIMAPASQMAKAANTRVSFQLNAPIVPAIDPIVSVDDTMSTGKKVDTALGNILGGLTGTSSYKVEQYTVRLDPAKFSASMGETMAGTQALIVARLNTAPAP